MRARIIFFTLLLVGIGVYFYFKWDYYTEPDYLHEFSVSGDKMYKFSGVKGPEANSVVPAPVSLSWRDYRSNMPSAFAIYLTDTASDWIGLVHGLKNIGVPVTVTNDIKQALQHKTVFVYPVISGKVLNKEQLQLLAAVPRNGGNLIAVNVYGGGLNEVFGFGDVVPSNKRSQLAMPNPAMADVTKEFTNSNEQTIRLTNQADFPDELPTNGYTNARTPLIVYQDDNTAFLTFKDYGVGKAYAFGLDLGTYFMRYMNERGFNANRTYANQYDPGMDVILRILKNIYQSAGDVVTVGSVPFNKSLSLVLTHDIDYTKSIINAVKYAELEKSLGVKGTYFIQTKYIKDWNDDIFYTDATTNYVHQVRQLGMEIASHSVSHSKVFSKFELGTGEERYPRYAPFVQERTVTYNGSILGELRVSKFLLEKLVPDVNVVSFRPGHLQYPFSLPQALMGTGYKYSSSVTANNVQTHLPYMQMYDRGFKAETDIVELPITIEDELGAPMLQRLDSAIAVAEALSAYGGVMNVLIHTDTLGAKLEFEKQLILVLRDKAWSGTVQQLGKWWYIRNQLRVSVQRRAGVFEVTVDNPSQEPITGITLQVPKTWVLDVNEKNCTVYDGAVVINKLTTGIVLKFTQKAGV